MNPSLEILRIAYSLRKSDPEISKKILFNVVAVINPSARSFKKQIKEIVDNLTELQKDFETALNKIDTDDAKEFADWFTDTAEAEFFELSNSLNKIKSASIAAPLDFIKNWFKKPKKEEEPTVPSSYNLSDDDVDDFVDGKKEWMDSSQYVEKDRKENQEFIKESDKLLSDAKAIKKNPSRDSVKSIIKSIKKLIRDGQRIIDNKYSYEEPVNIKLEEDSGEAKKSPAKKEKPLNFDSMIDHYADLLKNNIDDEKQLVKYLKEMFEFASPVLNTASTSRHAKTKLMKPLIRVASGSENLRAQLKPTLALWSKQLKITK